MKIFILDKTSFLLPDSHGTTCSNYRCKKVSRFPPNAKEAWFRTVLLLNRCLQNSNESHSERQARKYAFPELLDHSVAIVPMIVKTLKTLGQKLKAEIRVYRLVLRDKRTPRLPKVLLGLAFVSNDKGKKHLSSDNWS